MILVWVVYSTDWAYYAEEAMRRSEVVATNDTTAVDADNIISSCSVVPVGDEENNEHYNL
jgi:hypothetical protein